MRERLKGKLSENVITHLFAPTIEEDLNRSFKNMMEVNKAHLLMLVSERIISKETGRKINEALIDIGKLKKEEFNINYNLEDLYFNIEEKLIERVGMKIGGQLHTGRSRNDLNATVTRLNSRSSIFDVCSLLLEFRNALLKIANDNKNIVMSGYTHMQPAEPITLGHYFSAILFAMERDFSRFVHSFKNTNISPLGSGAMASTTFQINRNKTAELLGFTTASGNSLDSIASRDYMIEIISSINILMNTLSRLSYDLYIWSTYEYSLVEVDDSVAVSSSIMPQKKNPITLEHVKAKSSHVLGALVSITSSMKNTPYGHSRDIAGESQKLFWEGVNETKSSLILLTDTLKTIHFNEDKMLSQSEKNFSTVTELANMIVRKTQISFRQAHAIVGKIVSYLIEHNLTINNIDSHLIKEISLQIIKEEIFLHDEDIKSALDPILNVNSRNVLGGSAPDEVSNQLKGLRSKLEIDENWLKRQKEAINNQKEILFESKI